MKGTKHISEIFIEMAASNSDPLGRLLRRLPFIQAELLKRKSVLGTASKITGANLFTRLNYWVVYCGGDIMQNPPTLQGVEAPTEAVISLTPTKFTFELEGEPADAANLKLIVMASAPQSNGISCAYSKASQIGEPLEAACEEYDLKTAYDEKNGVPTSAAPKVFMKYFFVNTVTGEKSGEMLAVVSLKEDAAGE